MNSSSINAGFSHAGEAIWPVARLRTQSRSSLLPGWAFAMLAILLFVFLLLLGLLVVVYATYLGSETDSADRRLDRGWTLLSAMALGWGLVNLYWSAKAVRLLNPVAIYGHFTMVIACGLIALGIHSVLFARSIASHPIVMDFSKTNGPSDTAGTAIAAPAEGDAAEGRKIFSTTCITCHGPSGGGLPNLAPSLRGSAFVASADNAAIGNVIRLGRALNDPKNKSGKVMPARGGNPFLGDDKIVHLAAFIKAIQSEGPGTAAIGQGPNAPPVVQLARWVIPAGPAPPKGTVQLDARSDLGDAKTITLRNQQRRQLLLRSLTLGLTGVHGLFLVGVMIASSSVLVRRLMNATSRDDRSWWRMSSLGWIIALIAWLVVFLFGFAWL